MKSMAAVILAVSMAACVAGEDPTEGSTEGDDLVADGADLGAGSDKDAFELAAPSAAQEKVARAAAAQPSLAAASLAMRLGVNARYDRRFTWSMTAAPPPPVVLAPGEQRYVPVGVKFWNTGTVLSGHHVEGPLLIANTGATVAVIPTLVAFAGEVTATVTCPTPLPIVIPPGASVSCTYRADLPNGANRTVVAVAIASGGGFAVASGALNFAASTTVITDWDRLVEATATGVGHVYIADARTEPSVSTTYMRPVGPRSACGPFQLNDVAALRALNGLGSTRSGLLMINVPVLISAEVSCP